MSWQDDAMIEQDIADALFGMGEAEWRDMFFESMKRAKEDQDKMLKKAKRAEYNKRWREKHPEQMKKINRENAANWRAKNRDRYNKYMSEYRKRKGEKGSEVQNS